MNITNVTTMAATPQLTRTSSAHAGDAPLSSLSDLAEKGKQSEANGTRGRFESYLANAVSALNNQQLEVGRIEQQLITDPDSVDVHDVTTAMAKAQMSLSLAQTVIDRLITGWNELSTNR